MSELEEKMRAKLDGHFYKAEILINGKNVVVDSGENADLTDSEHDDTRNSHVVTSKYDIRNSIYTLAEAVPVPLRLAQIADGVCFVWKISRTELDSIRRAKKLVEARHVYFWIARHFTAYSYPQIGGKCGNRDHTTAMYGVWKVDRDFPTYAGRINAVLNHLGVRFEADLLREAA